jgi:type IV secretory pathway TrbD component
MATEAGGTLAGHRSDIIDTMNKDQILGPLREIAFAAGVALVTFGVTSQATVELVSGVLLAIVSLIFAIRANEGPEVVLTLVRKVLSGVAGGLVAWGKLDAGKAEALTGFALVLISSAWSFRAKGGGTGGGGISPLWVLALLALFLCPSCATVTTKTTVTDPKSGLVTVTETTTTSPDSASVKAVADTAQAYAPPRGIVIEVDADSDK